MNTTLESRRETGAAGTRSNPAMYRKPARQTWMISFADLMAILLTFMVISFSTKEINDVPWQQMSQSMLEAFNAPATTEIPTPAAGPTDGLAGDASDAVVAELIADRFPEMDSAGGISVTARGVEVDLAGNPGQGETAETVTRYLASLNRDVMVRVEASLPGRNPGRVQRTLAWENGLIEALALRSLLQEQGLSTRPDVQVKMATGSGRTTLVVKSAGRAGR